MQIVSEQTARQDIEITTLSKRFTIKETENSCLRREIDALKKDLRNQSSTSSSNEIKLNRTLEEVERLKATIKELRSEAKVNPFYLVLIQNYLVFSVLFDFCKR